MARVAERRLLLCSLEIWYVSSHSQALRMRALHSLMKTGESKIDRGGHVSEKSWWFRHYQVRHLPDVHLCCPCSGHACGRQCAPVDEVGRTKLQYTQTWPEVVLLYRTHMLWLTFARIKQCDLLSDDGHDLHYQLLASHKGQHSQLGVFSTCHSPPLYHTTGLWF